MIEPSGPGFQVKDFTDNGTTFTVEKRYLEDGRKETFIRMTYVRGKYVGYTFTITQATQLLNQIDEALAQAHVWDTDQ